MIYFFRPYNKTISTKILEIARPLIFTNISRVTMGIVDMMMVGRISKESIAAVGFSEAVQWIFIAAFGISTMIASQAIISRKFGESQYSQCVDALYCGQFISIITGVPISFLGYLYSDRILILIVDDPQILDLSIQYSKIIFIGIYFTVSSFAFRAFFTGVQKTQIYFKVILITNIINAYLNLGLIFGSDYISHYCFLNDIPFIGNFWSLYHFPSMGIRGAALGTVISSGIGMVLYLSYLFHSSLKEKFSYYPMRINIPILKRHIELLLPISVTEASHLIGWAIMLKIVGTLGTVSLAAMQIAHRVNHSSFMPAVGVGQACASLVGYYIGKGKTSVIAIVLKDSFRLAILIMGSIGLSFIVFPDVIIRMFSSDIQVINTAIPLIRFCGFMSIGEAVGIVMFSVLEGSGDTKFVSFVGITEMWVVFIPLCYLFIIVLGLGVWGAFYAWAIQLGYVIVSTYLRINANNWKNISI